MSHGLDEAAGKIPAELKRRLDRLESTVAGDARYGHTRDVLVMHRGEPVLALDRGRGTGEDLVDTYSITKSVVATLVGIALDDGAIRSLDEPVSRFLQGVRHRYTLRHLLTMTAGTETGGEWDIDAVMARASGWVDWILAAPARREPGETFAYDNGSTHVLGAAVAAAVGMPLSELAADHLFEPLEIETFEWPRDPDGRCYGFGHLRLRPRDLAKLGELYLADGAFRGRRVVSRSFVEAATQPSTAGGPPEGSAYGLLWWVGAEPRRHFFAAGYAGQSLTVISDLELVAVTIGDEQSLRPGWRNARHAVLDAFGR